MAPNEQYPSRGIHYRPLSSSAAAPAHHQLPCSASGTAFQGQLSPQQQQQQQQGLGNPWACLQEGDSYGEHSWPGEGSCPKSGKHCMSVAADAAYLASCAAYCRFCPASEEQTSHSPAMTRQPFLHQDKHWLLMLRCFLCCMHAQLLSCKPAVAEQHPCHHQTVIPASSPNSGC